MSDALLQSIPLALLASVPLLLAVLGELVVQRAGMIDLGIEGMMLTAALTSVVSAQMTGSVAAGFAGGVAGAAAIAAIYGAFVIGRRSDQIVTGTAINLLALGASGFLYREMQRGELALKPVPHAPANAQLVIAFIAWIAAPVAIGALLWMTTFGLRLRAAGENPEALSAAGASVVAHRWGALGVQALLVGIAGADLALAVSSGFAENMTAGRGFIALSIVIFGRWRPLGAVAGAALFGITAALQYALQANNTGVQFHLLLALPYVVTLLILGGVAGKVRSPEALGRN